MNAIHHGNCFCGKIKIEVQGQPEGMGYCHCNSCRSWSAAPVNAFTLWKPSQVKVVTGSDDMRVYNKTDISYRKYCGNCGGHIMTEHPAFDLIDVYAATIPTLAFKPTVHVYYGERVLSIVDGLPKMRDFPVEIGGTGCLVLE